MEISRFVWFFIDLGGSVSGRVIDNKPRRSPIPSAGLEIKLSLTFTATDPDLLAKMRTFIKCYNFESNHPKIMHSLLSLTRNKTLLMKKLIHRTNDHYLRLNV